MCFSSLKKTRKQNALTLNSYFFDTTDLDGDNCGRLSSCHLSYCSTSIILNFKKNVDESEMRIFNGLMTFRYRRNNYTSGVQLHISRLGPPLFSMIIVCCLLFGLFASDTI